METSSNVFEFIFLDRRLVKNELLFSEPRVFKNHCRVKAKETAKVNFKKVKMISYSLFENPFQNV